MLNRDNLFCKPHFPLDDFTFDAQVAAVFPDMLQRSIPGYQAILNTIGLLARRFIQPNSQVYDLGCSLGTAAFVIYHNLSVPGCNIIAIDNSAAMVNACQQQIDRAGTHQTMRVIEADIQSIKLENAAMAVLNFTLQFVDPKQRQGLLNRIYQGLNPGGILILSEKLRSADRNSEQLLDDLHLDFKRANGYSELEISQKRAALERVMQIDSAATHQHRLRQAGFSQITRWFHYLNFGSFIALKACS